jgi:hypothetical protein
MKPIRCKQCGGPIEIRRRGRTEVCAPCTWAMRDAKKQVKEERKWNQYAERFET